MKLAIVNLITRTPTNRKIPTITSNRDTMIVKLAREFVSLGHEVTLFVSDLYEPIEPEDLGIDVVYLKTGVRSIPGMPFVPELISRIRNGKFDAVLSSELFQWATLFEVIAWLTTESPPKIFIWQEMAIHQRFGCRIPSKAFHSLVLPLLLPAITKIVPRSRRSRAFLLKLGVSEIALGPTISHGADPFALRTWSDGAVEEATPYFFAPARLVAEKGIDLIFAALVALRKEGLAPRLIVIGDGPDAQDISHLIASEGLAGLAEMRRDRVDYDEMGRLYAGAVATIVASRRDNVILSSIESLLCGTPVIMSDAIDNSDDLVDHGGGIVVRSNDVEGLASAMRSLLTDGSLRARLSAEATAAAPRYWHANVARALVEVMIMA